VGPSTTTDMCDLDIPLMLFGPLFLAVPLVTFWLRGVLAFPPPLSFFWIISLQLGVSRGMKIPCFWGL
jgi:hypothetical protein